jgi:uncharacterized protein YceK
MARWVALMAVGLFTLNGCGTALNLQGDCDPYGGTRMAATVGYGGLATGLGVIEPNQKLDRQTCALLGCYAAADLPFSVIGDTVTLPITLTLAARPHADPDALFTSAVSPGKKGN